MIKAKHLKANKNQITYSRDSKFSADEGTFNQRSAYKLKLLTNLEDSLNLKLEQKLWSSFKKTINELQLQNKDKQKKMKESSHNNMNSFLHASIGFYVQFLNEILSTFSMVIPSISSDVNNFIIFNKSNKKGKQANKNSCLYLCQDCLVHLGDLARYRGSNDQALSYYCQASDLLPYNGQPYNQIAILEMNKGNKLSSIYHHIRAISLKYPFPVAEYNLQKFYSKISKDGYESRQKLASNGWISLFLQVHAIVHLQLEVEKAKSRADKAIEIFHENLPQFSLFQLLQISAINFYAIKTLQDKISVFVEDGCHVEGRLSDCYKRSVDAMAGGDVVGMVKKMKVESDDSFEGDFEEDVQTLKNSYNKLNHSVERFDVVVDLIVIVLDQMLLKADSSFNDSCTIHTLLPVIKINLDWLAINPNIIAHPSLVNSKIWLKLCSLLNKLVSVYGAFYNDSLSNHNTPLPEDAELKHFAPLLAAHKGLSFSKGISAPASTLVTPTSLPIKHGFDESLTRALRVIRLCVDLCQNPRLSFIKVKYSESGLPVSFYLADGKDSKRNPRINVAMQAIFEKNQKTIAPPPSLSPSLMESLSSPTSLLSSASLCSTFSHGEVILESPFKPPNALLSAGNSQGLSSLNTNSNNSSHKLNNFKLMCKFFSLNKDDDNENNNNDNDNNNDNNNNNNSENTENDVGNNEYKNINSDYEETTDVIQLEKTKLLKGHLQLIRSQKDLKVTNINRFFNSTVSNLHKIFPAEGKKSCTTYTMTFDNKKDSENFVEALTDIVDQISNTDNKKKELDLEINKGNNNNYYNCYSDSHASSLLFPPTMPLTPTDSFYSEPSNLMSNSNNINCYPPPPMGCSYLTLTDIGNQNQGNYHSRTSTNFCQNNQGVESNISNRKISQVIGGCESDHIDVEEPVKTPKPTIYFCPCCPPQPPKPCSCCMFSPPCLCPSSCSCLPPCPCPSSCSCLPPCPCPSSCKPCGNFCPCSNMEDQYNQLVQYLECKEQEHNEYYSYLCKCLTNKQNEIDCLQKEKKSQEEAKKKTSQGKGGRQMKTDGVLRSQSNKQDKTKNVRLIVQCEPDCEKEAPRISCSQKVAASNMDFKNHDLQRQLCELQRKYEQILKKCCTETSSSRESKSRGSGIKNKTSKEKDSVIIEDADEMQKQRESIVGLMKECASIKNSHQEMVCQDMMAQMTQMFQCLRDLLVSQKEPPKKRDTLTYCVEQLPEESNVKNICINDIEDNQVLRLKVNCKRGNKRPPSISAVTALPICDND